MAFLNPQENVVKVLELVGVTQVIPIYYEPEEAIKGMGESKREHSKVVGREG